MKSRVYLDTVLNLGATPSPQPCPPVGATEKRGVEHHFENSDEMRIEGPRPRE
jgi:hypothetical protein